MSRYVRVELELEQRDDLLGALNELALAFEVGPQGENLMLAGSLECAGDPVEVRLPAGTAGAVEDFGFVARDGRHELVCGELDRTRLLTELLPRLRQAATVHRARRAAARDGLELEQHIEPDGTRRLVLKRK